MAVKKELVLYYTPEKSDADRLLKGVLVRMGIRIRNIAPEQTSEKVGVLEMRRHLSCYFKGLPDFKATRLKLVTLTDPEQIVATLDEIARVWGDYDASEIVPKPLSHEV